MAVFPNWDLAGIRKHRKDNPEDELFKVIKIDDLWRMSSVVRVMHTHLVTFEQVFPEDHQTQADQYRRLAAMHVRESDEPPLPLEVNGEAAA
jgi:hypothetical protein